MKRAAPKLLPIHQRLIDLQRSALPNARPTPCAAAAIEAAEARLGRALPPGYHRFLAEVGRCYWPIDIRNLADFDRNPEHPSWFIPFADGNGSLWGFDNRRKRTRELAIVTVDPGDPEFDEEEGEPVAFERWLDERLDEAQPAPAPAAPRDEPIDDPELSRAAMLVHRLLEDESIETTRGFSVEDAARSIVEAWDEPERILDILEERQDILEIYLSEDELVEVQRSLDSDD